MRERKRFRKATAMVCLVSLAAGFSGCGEKEEKKTLRVITDQRLYDKVDMAARFMEGIHSRIRVEIQTLPGEGRSGRRKSRSFVQRSWQERGRMSIC